MKKKPVLIVLLDKLEALQVRMDDLEKVHNSLILYNASLEIILLDSGLKKDNAE